MMINVDGATETKYYYHYDGLGSVIALSDINSEIVERYSYDVFGEPNRVSDVNNPYYFTARRLDTETGLYYYRARYYKPDIGRFLQPDPLYYEDGLNLYTYVGNNPIRFIDPIGLDKLVIHSNYSHSWIEYVRDSGRSFTVGLWDPQFATRKGGGGGSLWPGTDLWMNIEKSGYKPQASRSYELNAAEIHSFFDYIKKDHSYNYTFGIPTNNCSSFASDCWKYITGERLNANDWSWSDTYGIPLFGTETPMELTKSIMEHEAKDSTCEPASED